MQRVYKYTDLSIDMFGGPATWDWPFIVYDAALGWQSEDMQLAAAMAL
jgi:hypothetical protein